MQGLPLPHRQEQHRQVRQGVQDAVRLGQEAPLDEAARLDEEAWASHQDHALSQAPVDAEDRSESGPLLSLVQAGGAGHQWTGPVQYPVPAGAGGRRSRVLVQCLVQAGAGGRRLKALGLCLTPVDGVVHQSLAQAQCQALEGEVAPQAQGRQRHQAPAGAAVQPWASVILLASLCL